MHYYLVVQEIICIFVTENEEEREGKSRQELNAKSSQYQPYV